MSASASASAAPTPAEIGHVKEHFRVYIAIDREIRRLAETRKTLLAQQNQAKEAIGKYLEDHGGEAIEYEGFVAGFSRRDRKVPGHSRTQRVDSAVSFVREQWGGLADPRTAVDRIQTLLAGPKEPIPTLRISAPKKSSRPGTE